MRAEPHTRPLPGPVSEREFLEYLGQTIHDGALQAVGVAILQLEICQHLCRSHDIAQTSTELDQALRTLEEAVDGLRAVMSAIHRRQQALA
jgi:signal transduction histidine kinase